MDNSAYIKSVLKSNETIALAAEKGGAAFLRGFKKSINQISAGAERLSWYSACFFDKYQEECRDIKQDDLRMMACIYEFFTRKDPVADLILMCVKYVFNSYDKNERIRILAKVYGVYESHGEPNDVPGAIFSNESSIYDCDDFLAMPANSPQEQKLLENIASICEFSVWDIIKEPLLDTDSIINPAKITTDLVARKTVAYAFAKAAADSLSLTLVVRKKLSKYGAQVAFVLFYYGIVHEAAMAAKKLKMLNPGYYEILYHNNLEMFFFLIEPYLPTEIYYPSLFLNNEDVAVNFLKNLLK